MIEKIKEFIKWVLIPLTAIAGFVYHMWQKNSIAREYKRRETDAKKFQKTLDTSAGSVAAADAARERYEEYKRRNADPAVRERDRSTGSGNNGSGNSSNDV